MRKIWLVARREYMENVRTKGFWIGILALPVLIALAVVVPQLLAEVKEARTYAVIDHSGFLLEEVERRILASDLERLLEAGAARYRAGGRAWDGLPEVLRQAVRAYVGLDEAARPGLVGELAGEERGAALRAWLQGASARELEGLEVELSRSRFARLEVPAGEDPQAELGAMLHRGKLFAYFVIGADPVASDVDCRYVATNQTDRELLYWFRGLAAEVVRTRRIEREGIDPQVARWIQRPLDFHTRTVGEGGDELEVGSRDAARQWAPVAFVYLLWIAVFTNAQALLTNTIEEKSSRVVEVLLSSLSPFELMTGKIAGMAASGLTVVGAWAAFFTVALVVVPEMLGGSGEALSGIAADPLYMFSFVFYFLGGYLLYATLLVGMGSVCNSLKEAQNLMLPVMIPLFVPLLAMVPVGQDPNGLLARILSFIPLFTPFVMMNRAAGPPPLWEYVATTALLVASIWLALRGAGKVFRIGILMTGKPPRLGEILRWMRLREGAVPAGREG